MNPYAPSEVRPLGQHHHRHHHYHHHHQQQSRYAHVSSSSRPLNLPSFSDNPNLHATQTLHHYHHQRHHPQSHLLPPPIQQPSPPAYHPSAATPRPLTASPSPYDFNTRGFNLIEDDRDRRSTYFYRHHHHALVDSDSRVLGGHDSHVGGNRAEFLDRRQTIGDNLVRRPYSNATLNNDLHRRAVEHRAASSYGPVDSSRPDSGTISRVRMRENYAEEFSFNQQDDLLRGSSRRFASVAGSSENEPHRDERGDNTGGKHSRVHDREITRELIRDYGKDFGTVAPKPEYHGPEYGRYSSANRGSGEVFREYSVTPKKQLPKKSAFLRLQLPRFSRRNRENEQHYSSNYHDDNAYGSLAFKGKGQGQFNYSDFGSKDKGEGESVDLDVSFKSNTLIAKTVIPPSSYRSVSEKDSIPLSKKLKSAIVSDKDSASLSLDKHDQNDEKLNSSSDMGAAISISKSSKELHERVDASDAQHKGNLGHLEGIVRESDAPVRSDCSQLSVSKATDVSSSTSEVGKSILSFVIDKAGNDLQCCNDAMGAAMRTCQSSRQLHERDNASSAQHKGNLGHFKGIVSESDAPFKSDSSPLPVSVTNVSSSTSEVGKSNLSSVAVKAGIDLQCCKDVVPKERESKDDTERDMVFDGVGKIVGSTQGKTADKELTGKAPSDKDAVPEGQDSNVVPKTDVISGNDGKSSGSGHDKTAEKILPSEAPPFKYAVPQRQDSDAGAKRVVVSDKYGKNGSSSRSKTAEKMLPAKAMSLKVARKKKIVKKVIRKVVNHGAVPLNRQTSGNHDKPLKADSHTASAFPGGSRFLRKEIEFCCVVNQDSNDETGILQQTVQTKGASNSISSEVCGKDANGSTVVVCGNRDGDCLSSSLCSTTCEETKSGTSYANNDHQIVLNPMRDLTVPLAQAVAEIRMDELSGHLPQDAKWMLLENQAGNDHLARNSNTTCLSNSGCFSVHDGCTDIDKSSPKEKAAFGPEEDLEDLAIVSSKESIDATGCNNSEADQLTTVPCEDSQSNIKAGACWVSGSSTVSEQNVTCMGSILSDDAGRQLSQVEDPRELDNGSKENLQNLLSPVEDCAPNAARSHDGISHVDTLSSREADINTKFVDATSGPSHIDAVSNSSINDPDLSVFSSLGGLISGLPTATFDLDASHGIESVDAALPPGTNVSVNNGSDSDDGGTSPVPRKRRKVCAPNQGSSDAMVPQNNDIALDADMTSNVWMQTIFSDTSIQPDVGCTGPGGDVLLGAASVSGQQETSILLKDNRQEGYSNVIGLARNDQLPGAPCASYSGQSVTVNGESLTQLITEGMPEENFPAFMSIHDRENPVIDHERSRDRELYSDPSERQVMSECDRLKFSNTEINFHLSDQKPFLSNIKDDASLSLKDESPSVSPYFSLYTDVSTVYASKSNDEVMKSVPDGLSDGGSSESLHNVVSVKISGGRALPSPLANEGVAKNNNSDNEENVVVRGLSVSTESALTLLSHDNLVYYSSDHAVETRCSVGNKTVSFQSNGSKSMNCSLKPSSPEPYGRMNWQSQVVQQSFPDHSSFTATNPKISSSNSTSKSNTWRRTNIPSAAAPVHKPSVGSLPAKVPLPGNFEKLQKTSYVRKGNSLVRKPAAAAPQTHSSHGTVPVHRLNSSDVHDLKKSTLSGHDDGINSMSINLRTGGRKTPTAKPLTSPQSSPDDLPNSNAVASASLTSFQAASPPVAVLGDPLSDTTGSVDNEVLETCGDARVTSEIYQDQTVSVYDSGNQNENFKRITYVKRKTNQLVATVNDSDLPIHMIDKPQCLPSKGYYKRKRNQLIRTSLETTEQTSSDKAKMEEQQGANVIFRGRRGSLKAKLCSPLSYASVWNLRGTSDNFNASNCEKFYPQFFPWKRVTYWRKFNGNSAAVGDNRSLSAIRRLMLSRKRDTVYVRSSHGFSLRKSKVVSVGGRSLKWSKSMERRTKKASEDATRAVAAVVKEKRQQKVPKNKSRSPRKRIFRIGNIRYKMDASRNSLIRISDEESALSVASQRGTNAKKSYVPRRLVIGNDEYVRISNGNQLVRNPKKRTRVLANEKVKWSLHTARLKLAKKRIYCQFFTRFGKCNKGDGKCPYIHDPSKIAVCTKFLSGSCSNEECKLTHKVIPERMPDCSYFLQGLCTNRNCPYRHVNVNPNSSTCEGFLRGYCADGNECRKKHSYVCPIYESTGNCHLGSKCKLHHPKSRTMGKKRKRSKEEKKSAMGRYFGGSTHVQPSDPRTSITEKFSRDENNIRDGNENLFEGSLADYIGLGLTDEEDEGESAGEIVHAMRDEANDDPDMELDDINYLIKPIGIMDVNV